jgi:hypothetical protein
MRVKNRPPVRAYHDKLAPRRGSIRFIRERMEESMPNHPACETLRILSNAISNGLQDEIREVNNFFQKKYHEGISKKPWKQRRNN